MDCIYGFVSGTACCLRSLTSFKYFYVVVLGTSCCLISLIFFRSLYENLRAVESELATLHYISLEIRDALERLESDRRPIPEKIRQQLTILDQEPIPLLAYILIYTKTPTTGMSWLKRFKWAWYGFLKTPRWRDNLRSFKESFTAAIELLSLWLATRETSRASTLTEMELGFERLFARRETSRTITLPEMEPIFERLEHLISQRRLSAKKYKWDKWMLADSLSVALGKREQSD
ncbi:hypothetical protein QBC32DRAFT_109408 [Pseudoneurospora amorphoporcata]|uniref:Uncharacterized protein n=1 Tax=Pseudoneurospora amorphoporcata TaxID=241081 RepID=A0AAN6P310_9PEZI|nr:hypothetical protein QBC32DRAFT_109408 [Pseudoneurospora amorphoporcata]